MADGFLPPLARPETGGLSSALYPLRGAEAVGIIAVMSVIFWVFTILVPEYCLAVWEDAKTLGTPSMGGLVVLISAVPALILLPLILIYALQYLGRVLVSSAMGETVPPRTPDRNFEGFFNGLSPWLAWLFLGASVGLLPLALYSQGRPLNDLANPLLIYVLALPVLPYTLMALMLSFLHDRPLAAIPTRVLGALLIHGVSFLPTFLNAAAVLGLGATAFAAALAIRASYYWLYIVVALGCWGVAFWAAVVVMRLLGVYYFHHKETLGWLHASPRWGVAWRL